MKPQPLALRVLPDVLAICRLPRDADLSGLTPRGSFWSMTRTERELSLVVPEPVAPDGAKMDTGWRCLEVQGPLDLDLCGVMARLATALAQAGVPVFPIATHDTDYLLVRGAQLDIACAALRADGHRVEPG